MIANVIQLTTVYKLIAIHMKTMIRHNINYWNIIYHVVSITHQWERANASKLFPANDETTHRQHYNTHNNKCNRNQQYNNQSHYHILKQPKQLQQSTQNHHIIHAISESLGNPTQAFDNADTHVLGNVVYIAGTHTNENSMMISQRSQQYCVVRRNFY